MSKHKFWFGFLEAGEKSTPVVIDHNLHTGENDKVFIYNHNKQEILKYVREIVNPKLRELTAQEKDQEASLKKGFLAALKTIKYPVVKPLSTPTKATATPKAEKPPEEPEEAISQLDDEDWGDSDE